MEYLTFISDSRKVLLPMCVVVLGTYLTTRHELRLCTSILGETLNVLNKEAQQVKEAVPYILAVIDIKI